jgi:DNA-binding NarL/FixJ family response regulator
LPKLKTSPKRRSCVPTANEPHCETRQHWQAGSTKSRLHVSIDRLRQRAKTVQRQVDAPVEDLAIADQKQPSALTIVQQTESVQRYVADLSDARKAVLLLHDADGLTAEEISRLLQLPLTTVKMRLHRARHQLQAALDKACAFGRDERGVFVCEPKPDSK